MNKLKTIKKCDTKFLIQATHFRNYICFTIYLSFSIEKYELNIIQILYLAVGMKERKKELRYAHTVNCKAALLDKSMYLCHFSAIRRIFAPLSRLLLHFFRANVSLFICHSRTQPVYYFALPILHS